MQKLKLNSHELSCITFSRKDNSDCTDVDKPDVITLAKVDTLHDMWGKRGTKKNPAPDIKPALDQVYKNLDEREVKTFMAADLCTLQPSGDDFQKEPQAAEFFEQTLESFEKGKLPSLCDSDLIQKSLPFDCCGNHFVKDYTFGDFKKDFDDRKTNARGPLLDFLTTGMGKDINSIEIKFPDKINKKKFYKEKDKEVKYIAQFIKDYFRVPTGVAASKVAFSIDSNFGELDKIFHDIDEAFTMQTVLNIADSANTTDLTTKGNCKFHRPYPDTPFPYNGSEGTLEYLVDSHYFTKDKDSKIFEKILYKSKDDIEWSLTGSKSSIELVVVLKDNEKFSVPFGITGPGNPVQGTSVTSIRKIIKILHTKRINPSSLTLNSYFDLNWQVDGIDLKNIISSNELNTMPLIRWLCTHKPKIGISPLLLDNGFIKTIDIIKFLIDYKRMGDYEQVRAVKHIMKSNPDFPLFVTGDCLCSIYARYEKINVIYCHGDYMTLYRQPRNLNLVELYCIDTNRSAVKFNSILMTIKNIIDEWFEFNSKTRFQFKLPGNILTPGVNLNEFLEEYNEHNKTLIEKYSHVVKKKKKKDNNTIFIVIYNLLKIIIIIDIPSNTIPIISIRFIFSLNINIDISIEKINSI